MRAATGMGEVDFFGASGGQLAMAFAAGCVATFAFMMAIGSFIWRLVGDARLNEIKQVRADLTTEKERCGEMETRLVARIEQLETILLYEAMGNVRQGAQLAVSELRNEISARREAKAKEEGDPA